MNDKPVALVTGCSTGVGLYTATRLAQAGYHVVATMRDTGKQQPLLDQAKIANVEVDVRPLDVTDRAAIDACVDAIVAEHGRIDVLVNNAGAGILGSVEQISDADLRQMMEVNFFGVWNATKAVVPHMRKAGSGRIVSVTSLGALVGQPFNDAYCAAKFAVEGMMESFAPLALPMGIRVCVVAPGPVNTEFVSNLNANSTHVAEAMSPPYDKMMEQYALTSGHAFETHGQTADEVAEIVVDVATADKPDFRTLTGPLVKNVVAAKAADVTSNSLVQNFAKVFAGWSQDP